MRSESGLAEVLGCAAFPTALMLNKAVARAAGFRSIGDSK